MKAPHIRLLFLFVVASLVFSTQSPHVFSYDQKVTDPETIVSRIAPFIDDDTAFVAYFNLKAIKNTKNFKPLPQDDPRRRCPDISLAKEKLRWEPKSRSKKDSNEPSNGSVRLSSNITVRRRLGLDGTASGFGLQASGLGNSRMGQHQKQETICLRNDK